MLPSQLFAVPLPVRRFPFRSLLALLALAGAGVCSNVQAALPQSFDRFSTKDGLSHNWVTTVHQDRQGFIWVGTKDGLNRFDAYTFKTYAYDASSPRSLPNSSINVICDAPDGDLFVGTSNGVARYRLELDGFETVDAIPSHDALSAAWQGDTLWVGTNQGLFRYDPKTDEATAYLRAPEQPAALPDHMCRALFVDSQGALWVGTNKSLSRYDPATDAFQNYFLGGGPKGSQVNALCQDAQGRLWVGTEQHGLFVANPRQTESGPLAFERIMQGSVFALAIDQQDVLWVGHRSSLGIDFIDLQRLPHQDAFLGRAANVPANPRSLSGNSIQCLFADRNGDMWVGVYNHGLNFHSPQHKPFFTFQSHPDDANTLSNDSVNALVQEGRHLWIGTNRGLNRYHLDTGHWQRFPVEADSARSPGDGGIFSLHRDTRGQIWVGGWGLGLSRYRPDTETFHTFQAGPQDGESINNNHVYAIQDDGRGSLWIGTIGGGLNRYRYETGRFTYYRQDPGRPDALHDDYVNDILLSRSGVLWISTYNTLNRYHPETDGFTHYTREAYQGAGMPNADLLDLFEDSLGAIWMGTEGGLVRFDPEDETFTQYNQNDGLQQNTINAIEEDPLGNLWLSTNRGLVCFRNGIKQPSQPEFRFYEPDEGLVGSQYLPRASLATDGGRLFFGGVYGLTYFDPVEIKGNPHAPPVALTEFYVFNQPVQPAAESSPLNTAISATHALTLTPDQSVFTLRFAALNYVNPDLNRYRYRLRGFETKWNETGIQRAATYTSLSPGEYTFEVYGSNNDGVWSEQPRSLALTILPPFYLTKPFLLSSALAAVLAVYFLYRARVSSLRKQRAQLASQVEERTRNLHRANLDLADRQEEIERQNAELERHRNRLEELVAERTAKMEAALTLAEDSERLKSAFLANVSHEIRTPMNAIVGFSSLLDDPHIKEDERAEYVELVRNNADALISLIDEIVEISRIEANQIQYNLRPFDLDLKLEELEIFFKAECRSEVELAFLPPAAGRPTIIVSDELLIGQIMTSLIGNALKYTRQGKVEFGYRLEDDQVLLYVADTGIGIPSEEHERIFDRFYKVTSRSDELYRGLGLGLSITRSLVNLIKGRIWVESEPGKGSTFYVRIPNGKTDATSA